MRQRFGGDTVAARATLSSGILLPLALVDHPRAQSSSSDEAPRPRAIGPSSFPSADRAPSGRAAALGISLAENGDLSWSCHRCGTQNSIDYLDCPVCGWSLFQPLKGQPTPERPPCPHPSRVRLWSIVPGGGQWALGRKGDGLARAALVVWLLGVGVALSDPLVRWAQFLFLAAGVTAWVLSARDALSSATHSPPGEGGASSSAGSRGADELLGGRRVLAAFLASLMALFSVSFFLAYEVAKSTSKLPATATERTDPSSGATVSEPVGGPPVGAPTEGGSRSTGPLSGPPAGIEGVS